MYKKTLVLGASMKESRYSNMAIKRLLNYDYEVKAIGLVSGEIDGVIVETGEPHFEDIDTVTLYLNPKRQESYYEYILSIKPKRVIFNPGTENIELIKLLQENNITVEIACTLVLLSTDQY